MEWEKELDPSISAVSNVELHPSMEGGTVVVAHVHPIPRLTEEMDELVDTRVVFNSYLSSFFNSPIQIVSL
jgi:hypothetical protein